VLPNLAGKNLMQAYQDNISAKVNGTLTPILGVQVTVTDTSTGKPAALYSDNGVTVLAQPLTTDETGYFGFYAANGHYSLSFASPQIKLGPRVVQLYDPADDQPLTQAQAAAASGASKLGYGQRTVENKLGEFVSVKDAPFNAKGDGVTDDTASIQAAINALSAAGGGVLWVPVGFYPYSQVTLKSNITIDGSGTLVQSQAPTAQAGFCKAAGGGSLANVHIRGVTFDGARVANPGYQYQAIISIDLGVGETLDNFTVTGANFLDAQDHFIRIIASGQTALATNIKVRDSRFVTTPAKRSLGGGSDAVAFDAVRFEQTWDYATGGNGYGTINFKHIDVSRNYAESIRTLADLKRGCSHFVIQGNRTKNMYDCHHSVDGGFHGAITANVCEIEGAYAGPGTFTDFIEVQGEHITISGNSCNGGGKTVSGIFVTDYGRPQEMTGTGKNIGHRSVAVTITGNTVKNITSNAFRVLNGLSCSIRGNHCETVTNHVATIESGTGRYDATDALLVATGCTISGNSSKGAGLGVKFQGSGHVKGINPDEYGQDYLYCPGFALADIYGNFVTEGATRSLNPNRELAFTGTAANNLSYFDADFYPAVTAAATRPNGAVTAITLNDESAAAMRVAYSAAHVPVAQNDRLYIRVKAKKNSANNFGVIVQEYDSSGAFLSNTFYGTAGPANWTTYLVGYKVANATAAYVRIGLLPANSSNDVTATGSTDFAEFDFSRTALGR
jgi:hypothetical protein